MDPEPVEESRTPPLTMVTLYAGFEKIEVWDVKHNIIIVYRKDPGQNATYVERPVTDSDRWQLSRIATTIDREMFNG